MKVLGIQRSERFSPNSVDKDLAILRAVIERFDGEIVSEDDICKFGDITPNLILSMARHPSTLRWLSKQESQGAVVINTPEGVKNCSRTTLERIMKAEGIPFPPAEGHDGYWIKRADASAETKQDVVFCHNLEELNTAKAAFRARGINDFTVQAHIKGDLIKFYGVADTDFFQYFYPGDDNLSKFGDEAINGTPHHFLFNKRCLFDAVKVLFCKAKVDVYGGDAIITEDGKFYIIDFNDWPSFSRCRQEAAEAIKDCAEKRMKQAKQQETK